MRIQCTSCGNEIEIDAALQDSVRAEVQTEEHARHEAELERVRSEAQEDKARSLELARKAADKALLAEREALEQRTATDLEIEKKKLLADAESAQKRRDAESALTLEKLKDDARAAEERSLKLAENVKTLTDELRAMRHAAADAELANKKEQAEAEERVRQEVKQSLEEKRRLELAEKDKTISDMSKALEEARRKAEQGSQQLQGEILELDVEAIFRDEFRDDDIEPVAKGQRGGDINHVIRNRGGSHCGVIIWEIKRTKNWTDGWIPKLKDDLRNAKANVAVIVTEVMPKGITRDIGQIDGVWICRPQLALVLGTLLRNGLLDVARQRGLQ